MFGHYPDDLGSQQENEMSQGCAKQSEENDGLEQQLKDAQYTRTGDAHDDCGDGNDEFIMLLLSLHYYL